MEEDAAAEGAYLLDRHGPPGWYRAINKALLDLAGCGTCVLGQVYGFYGHGIRFLRLTQQDAVHFGFAAPLPRYPALKAAWLAEIAWRERRDAEALVAVAAEIARREERDRALV